MNAYIFSYFDFCKKKKKTLRPSFVPFEELYLLCYVPFLRIKRLGSNT